MRQQPMRTALVVCQCLATGVAGQLVTVAHAQGSDIRRRFWRIVFYYSSQ